MMNNPNVMGLIPFGQRYYFGAVQMLSEPNPTFLVREEDSNQHTHTRTHAFTHSHPYTHTHT